MTENDVSKEFDFFDFEDDGFPNFENFEELKTEEEIAQSIHRSTRASLEHYERGNLVYLPVYWLHEGPKVRKVAQAVIVKRHADESIKGIYVQIQVWKREKQSQPFKKEKDIRLELEDTRRLLSYLNQAEIAIDSEKEFVPLPIDEIFDNLNEEQRQTFANLISDIARSRRVAELFSMGQLNSETIEHLVAAAQQVKYKAALNELVEMVNGEKAKKLPNGKEKAMNEHDYQGWFEKHTWVFGTEYIRKIDLRAIDPHSTVDFILETADGFYDVLELKTPQPTILDFDKSHKTWYFTQDISKVIAQAAKYLKAIDRNADRIQVDTGYLKLVRPRVRIVIGRSKHWDQEQHEAFRRLVATLHNIEIMTFDHVIQRAQQLIYHYESFQTLEIVELTAKQDQIA